MDPLLYTDGLTGEQADLLAVVRDFVDREIIPVAAELDRADSYPTDIVRGLQAMGVFGLTIPEEFGGSEQSLLIYALVIEEISRGWMSVAGILNTHFIVAHLLMKHGTPEQRRRYLPRMADGSLRAAFSMSEPGCGSDVAAITSTATRVSTGWRINGTKMWLTNGATAGLVAVLVRTDTGGTSAQQNMSTFLIEKQTGLGTGAQGISVPTKIDKLGYKGVDTTELVMTGHLAGDEQLLGGIPGRGFAQMMDGVEVGRVNVAARACGVALRALQLAIEYARQRTAFGKPIAQHQAVLFRLADMASRCTAAHQLTVRAARHKHSGGRGDLESSIAKYLASEYCMRNVEDGMRIHGGYGYSTDYEIERLYREAPMLVIGEGTSDIQRLIIGRRLLQQYHPDRAVQDGIS